MKERWKRKEIDFSVLVDIHCGVHTCDKCAFASASSTQMLIGEGRCSVFKTTLFRAKKRRYNPSTGGMEAPFLRDDLCLKKEAKIRKFIAKMQQEEFSDQDQGKVEPQNEA